MAIILIIILRNSFRTKKTYSKSSNSESCTALTCGAMDPVSDPKYNMRELAKQSILLEEHLIEKNKYCRDCIIKHFLHIIGLAEEAQMLAGDRINNYPLLEDAPNFYRTNMDNWFNDENNKLAIAATLREYRKEIFTIYYASS